MQKLTNVQRYAKIRNTPFDQRSLIHREAWFPPCFVRQNQQQKKNFYLRSDFRPLPNKNVQMLDHFFSLFFPKDSESLKLLDIRLREVGAKRPVNGTSKLKKSEKKKKNCAAILDNFQTKMFISETTSFHYFSPRIPNLKKILDIRLREVGAKRPLNGTSKVNRHTDRRTDTQTDRHFDLQKASAQRADALKMEVVGRFPQAVG